MISHTARRFASALLTLAVVAVLSTSHAELRSQSGELVVVEPHSLPEAAQLGGNSFFLHADDSGSTYCTWSSSKAHA